MRIHVTLAAAGLLAAVAATPATAKGPSGHFTAFVPEQGAVAVDYSKSYREIIRDRRTELLKRVLGNDYVEANPEIIGGKKARKGRWPGQVGLLQSGIPDNYRAQFCGGSLIRAQWVLTAAHCVDQLRSVDDVEILTGTQSLKKGGSRHAVAGIWISSDYDPDTVDSDIALIKLTSPVRKPHLYEPAHRAFGRDYFTPGREAFVTGWGNTSTTSVVNPVHLRQVKLPFVSRRTCNRPNAYDGRITRRMVCAGFRQGGKDSCQGDSGGPMLIRQDGERRTQVGIVSWGFGCAQPNLYGVYTNVPYFARWIDELIRNN